MNKQIDKDFLVRLKGAYQTKYGFAMDDWTTIILYEIREQLSRGETITKESAEEILKASQHIKGQVYPVHFKNDRQAFWYGFGKNLPAGIAVCVIAVLVYWIVYTYTNYPIQSAFVEQYPNATLYQLLIQNGDIEERGGKNCLILSPQQKGHKSEVVGKEYFFDGKRNKVVVPLN